ncbi:hypothetical protein D1007_03084 [Hordeum vulgare]|nr:hypothetical protein D1007_03084 [Hordeum vulgare]
MPTYNSTPPHVVCFLSTRPQPLSHPALPPTPLMRPSAAAAAAFLASSSRPPAAWFCSGGRGASLYAASSPLPRTRPPRLGSGSGHLKITMEEWRVVAKAIVTRKGELTHRATVVDWPGATVVDWPGLGYSDRPSLNYNADVLENFLVQLLNSPNSPLANAESADTPFTSLMRSCLWAMAIFSDPFLTIFVVHCVCQLSRVNIKNVLGRCHRYGLLRGTLRAPAIGWMMYNVLVSNEKSIQSQYKSHVYANPENVTPEIVESRYELTKRKGARYVPAAFLTGLLDPVQSREEFLQLFAKLDGDVPVLVVSTPNSPKRSKAEMEAFKGAKGVTKFVEVPGALLPQEEYPFAVAEELYDFLQGPFSSGR